jgi:hypothetical protein
MVTNSAFSHVSLKQPQLTSSDIQGIRKFVEDVKTDIANGKAVEALKTLNQIDDKLLVAMSVKSWYQIPMKSSFFH